MLFFKNTVCSKLADVLTFSAVIISFTNIQKLEHLNPKSYSRTKKQYTKKRLDFCDILGQIPRGTAQFVSIQHIDCVCSFFGPFRKSFLYMSLYEYFYTTNTTLILPINRIGASGQWCFISGHLKKLETF